MHDRRCGGDSTGRPGSHGGVRATAAGVGVAAYVRRGSPEQEKPDRVQEGGTTMRVITREEIVAEATETARRAGLTFEEFMAEGKSDMLTDAACRDMWLLFRDELLEQ